MDTFDDNFTIPSLYSHGDSLARVEADARVAAATLCSFLKTQLASTCSLEEEGSILTELNRLSRAEDALRRELEGLESNDDACDSVCDDDDVENDYQVTKEVFGPLHEDGPPSLIILSPSGSVTSSQDSDDDDASWGLESFEDDDDLVSKPFSTTLKMMREEFSGSNKNLADKLSSALFGRHEYTVVPALSFRDIETEHVRSIQGTMAVVASVAVALMKMYPEATGSALAGLLLVPVMAAWVVVDTPHRFEERNIALAVLSVSLAMCK